VPYSKRKLKGGKVSVINSKTGEVYAKATTSVKANAQERLLNAVKHNPDFKPGHAKMKKRVMGR